MHTDLERGLRALAAEVAWPPTPDLAGRVVARLPAQDAPAARARRPRRRLVVALAAAAALLVPAGAAFGDELLEWLGLRSVEIRREPRLPPGARRPALDDLGARVTLAEAARRAGFRPVLPPRLGRPDEVRARGRVVTLVFDGGATLLAQVPGSLVVRKTVTPGAGVDPVPGGVFLSGPEHTYAYLRPDGRAVSERPFLAADTLLLQRGDVLLRLEGRDLTARRALRLLGAG